jgi:predicted secreted protein
MDQLVPFHRSANVSWRLVLFVYLPTAVQAVAEVHETALRMLPVAPVGLGTASIDQLVPFQRSASITCLPVALMAPPTAVQAVAEVQDTAHRFPLGEVGGGTD